MPIEDVASFFQFLYQLAMDLQFECYCLHYFLDYPQLAYTNSGSFINESETKKLLHQHLLADEVPNIFKYIFDFVNGKQRKPYPYIQNVNPLSKKVLQVSVLSIIL